VYLSAFCCVESGGGDEDHSSERGDTGDTEGQGDSGNRRRRSARPERGAARSGQQLRYLQAEINKQLQ